MNADAGSARRPRRSRGERTRQAILDATLRVIADGGVRAVTHRAVAQEAGVNVSLTTYYFSDIFDMVSSAFNDFVERERPRVERAWQEVFECVYRYSAAERRRKAIREEIRARLTAIGVDYLLEKIRNQRAGMAVEHHFYFEALSDERLRSLYESSREPIIEEMTEFAALFNRDCPRVDAEILSGAILNIEHHALIEPPDNIDRRRMEALLGRVVGWIMKLNDPV
jgi:DNA-binding transcriptional regulator YbjK